MTYPYISGGEIPPPPPPPSQHEAMEYMYRVTREEGRGFQTTALVCGIVGSTLGLVPLFFLFSWVLGLVAFVMGLIAWSRRRDADLPHAMAKWGFALGILSFVLGCIGYVIVSNAFTDLDRDFDCMDRAVTAEQVDACVEP